MKYHQFLTKDASNKLNVNNIKSFVLDFGNKEFEKFEKLQQNTLLKIQNKKNKIINLKDRQKKEKIYVNKI
jgi:hypothetical protein